MPDRRDAVRAGYDAVAPDYAAKYADELSHKPLDRALLAVLAIDVRGPDWHGGRGGSPVGAIVADLGCGPGHVAAFLSEYGLRTVGIDLSPEMIGLARAAHPGVTYEVGDMLALPAGDGEWFGLVAMYSIVHFDDSQLSVAAGEFARVLRPGAPALVAFHGGDEIRHVEDFFGRGVELDFRLFDPAAVVAALEGAGLHVEAHLERDAYLEIEAPTRRVYLLCRRT